MKYYNTKYNTRVIADYGKALKINDILINDITIIGIDADLSQIEEIDIKEKIESN